MIAPSENISISESVKLPYGFAKRHEVLITTIDDQSAIKLIHTAKLNFKTLLEVRRFVEQPFILEEVSIEAFQTLLTKCYEVQADAAQYMVENIETDLDLSDLVQSMPKAEDLLESENDAPIIRLLNALFSEAIKKLASDIHVETFEDRLLIRFRIDGVLRIVLEPPSILAPLLISRIKVMAKLDIAEKRLPQDGRISLHIAGRVVDVRVSTLPSTHGERVVLRLLDKKAGRLDLTDLGMSEQTLQVIQKVISKPHGIILVTGPTGSGKTTSLYAMLSQLNDSTRNILTVEDPVEYYLPGIGQTQVNIKANMTFARALRAMLRQDPDVVMVGEIRDLETAEIAVQASLTGHLVLSTLHTNSAAGAITRLQDMGIEPFLLASSLICVMAQRLVRLLCPACKKQRYLDASEAKLLNVLENQAPVIFDAMGCEQCSGTGYSGRSGIYEIIMIDEDLRNMIHEKSSELRMELYARTLLPSIRQDGYRRVLAGETTLEEVLRVSSAD